MSEATNKPDDGLGDHGTSGSSVSSPVPQLFVEQLAAGELNEARAESVMARLQAETDGLARLEAVQTSNEAILSALPSSQVAERIERKLADALRVERAQRDATAALESRDSGIFEAWRWLAPAAVATLGLAFMLRTGPAAEPGESTDKPTAAQTATSPASDGDRAKGLTPHLQVFRKRGDDAERLRDGQRAWPRDVLQLRYVAGDAAFGTIVSIDGNGETTLHFPERSSDDTALESGKAIALPHAYELDDAPQFERFMLITHERPVDVEMILDASRGIASTGATAATTALDLPAGFRQFSFRVQKVRR